MTHRYFSLSSFIYLANEKKHYAPFLRNAVEASRGPPSGEIDRWWKVKHLTTVNANHTEPSNHTAGLASSNNLMTIIFYLAT